MHGTTNKGTYVVYNAKCEADARPRRYLVQDLPEVS